MTPQAGPWFVAIGASGGGGLDDIRGLVAALPASLRAVVLVVLHRPWDKPTRLRSILAHESRLPIVVATDGERFEPGTIYIGEPAEHLTLAARSFGRLVQDPDAMHRNRTVDLLFHSVAQFGGGRIIGVVLSGSLDDGSRGLHAIHKAAGLTMVLAPFLPAAPWSGMPENAIAYDGPVDIIGSRATIAAAICAAVGDGLAWPSDFRSSLDRGGSVIIAS